jgi:hypothetical protein
MSEVDPDLEQVMEWKRAFSAEVNSIPPEKQVEYINRQAEIHLREAGLLHHLVRGYHPYTSEESGRQ